MGSPEGEGIIVEWGTILGKGRRERHEASEDAVQAPSGGHCGLCGGSLRGDSDKGARRRTKVDIIVRQSPLPEGVQGLDAALEVAIDLYSGS